MGISVSKVTYYSGASDTRGYQCKAVLHALAAKLTELGITSTVTDITSSASAYTGRIDITGYGAFQITRQTSTVQTVYINGDMTYTLGKGGFIPLHNSGTGDKMFPLTIVYNDDTLYISSAMQDGMIFAKAIPITEDTPEKQCLIYGSKDFTGEQFYHGAYSANYLDMILYPGSTAIASSAVSNTFSAIYEQDISKVDFRPVTFASSYRLKNMFQIPSYTYGTLAYGSKRYWMCGRVAFEF